MEREIKITASVRYYKSKLDLAKKETGQKTLQQVVDYLLDGIWYKYNHPPQLLGVINSEKGVTILNPDNGFILQEKPYPIKPKTPSIKAQYPKDPTSIIEKDQYSIYTEELKSANSYEEVGRIVKAIKEDNTLLHIDRMTLIALSQEINRNLNL